VCVCVCVWHEHVCVRNAINWALGYVAIGTVQNKMLLHIL